MQKAVFLLAAREADKAGGKAQLKEGQALYVEGPAGDRYLVAPDGTKHLIGSGGTPSASTDGSDGDGSGGTTGSSARDQVLRRSLFSEGAQAQKVTKDWLATLHDGTPITFPQVPGRIGDKAGIGSLDPRLDKVGTVIQAVAGKGVQQYVVLPGKVAPVSDLVARLLLTSPDAVSLGQNARAAEVAPQSFTSSQEWFYGKYGWPKLVPSQANDPASGRGTVCNVLHDVDGKGTAELTTWAGPRYPAQILDGATSAYVTPPEAACSTGSSAAPRPPPAHSSW
ncbi:hypothetical protein GCM10020000_21690 [Streptomyces olivoverticillatus]